MGCNCSSSMTHVVGIMAQVDCHKFAHVSRASEMGIIMWLCLAHPTCYASKMVVLHMLHF